jgi:mannose-6-phosphate isomerase-like protein (cupin superfamily)
MPVIKGASVPAGRNRTGVFLKDYPLGPDQDLLHFVIFSTREDWAEKWTMQTHKHRDFDEYWFILSGRGRVTVGADTYEVQAGDLVITPPNTPHRAEGDLEVAGFSARRNLKGQDARGKMQYEGCDTPYRDKPEDLPPPGRFQEIPLEAILKIKFPDSK